MEPLFTHFYGSILPQYMYVGDYPQGIRILGLILFTIIRKWSLSLSDS